MGPFMVYGALCDICGPLWCLGPLGFMGPFRVYGALYGVCEPLVYMGPFRVYGALYVQATR